MSESSYTPPKHVSHGVIHAGKKKQTHTFFALPPRVKTSTGNPFPLHLTSLTYEHSHSAWKVYPQLTPSMSSHEKVPYCCFDTQIEVVISS